MALVGTTLAAAIAATDKQFNLTSGTDAAIGRILRVNDEFMMIQGFETPKVIVQRGKWGTNAIAHGILSPAIHGLPADFPPRPKPRLYSYGAAAPAITPAPGTHRLFYAGATAATLAAPTLDMDGETLLFIAGTAQAHVITLDSGYWNNTSYSIATWAAAIGNCLEVTVVAIGATAYYCVTVNKNITLS